MFKNTTLLSLFLSLFILSADTNSLIAKDHKPKIAKDHKPKTHTEMIKITSDQYKVIKHSGIFTNRELDKIKKHKELTKEQWQRFQTKSGQVAQTAPAQVIKPAAVVDTIQPAIKSENRELKPEALQMISTSGVFSPTDLKKIKKEGLSPKQFKTLEESNTIDMTEFKNAFKYILIQAPNGSLSFDSTGLSADLAEE